MTPTDIDRDAPVVVKLEHRIAAPVAAIWALHTNVVRWADWQKDVRSIELTSAFAPGASFDWTTEGLDEPVCSTIYAVDPERSTLWGGPAAGITGVHRWSFEADGNDTFVTTEESWAGAPVLADIGQARAMLEASLARWLDFLGIAATSAGR